MLDKTPFRFADDALLDTRQAAKHLGIKTNTLATWRSNKRYDLPYIRVGRYIRYRTSDPNKFLESRTVTSGGDHEC